MKTRLLILTLLATAGCGTDGPVLTTRDGGFVDAGPLDAAPLVDADDSGSGGDAGGPDCTDCFSCEHMRATGVLDCADPVALGYGWLAGVCRQVYGCECAGVDCDRLFPSETECVTAAATCSPTPTACRWRSSSTAWP